MLTIQQYLELITNQAKTYRFEAKKSVLRNDHLNSMDAMDIVYFKTYFNQHIIDAILSDFINFIAANQGVDYGLHSTDLRESPRHISTEPD